MQKAIHTQRGRLTRSLLLCLLLGNAWQANGAEVVRLSAETWDEYAPHGKEVDCIYGDLVMRNDQIVVVIAAPIAGRNANMTVRGVGGAIIDLTDRRRPNDQLSAFYPGAGQYELRAEPVAETTGDSDTLMQGGEVRVVCQADANEGLPSLRVTYRLTDNSPYIEIESEFHNPHSAAIRVPLQDAVRADNGFTFGIDNELSLAWMHDEWWHQAYGIVASERQVRPVGDSAQRGRPVYEYVLDDEAQVRLEPDASYTLMRRLIPARSLVALWGAAHQLHGADVHSVRVLLQDQNGPVHNAQLAATRDGTTIGVARSDEAGRIEADLPEGTYQFEIQPLGRPSLTVETNVVGTVDRVVELAPCGYVRASIVDEAGGPIPCKVQFQGREGSEDPNFGPDTYEHAVRNLYYSHDGQFVQELAPGKYDVIVSYGNEYDAVYAQLEIKANETAELTATLRRTVDSSGWISSDFHSHSSPSGDNTASQLGRVLNLLGEHIEFAPCTEHNRITSYIPLLEKLDVMRRMATCSGIELTGSPLPVNHQNAFPLIERPRTQDGGGPTTDENPVVQIERLAFWDQRAQKVVQGNHPDIAQIIGDRDLDGTPDGGFNQMFDHMDVVEVHPPAAILDTTGQAQGNRGNVIRNWMKMLNLGYRIPGVVNTDAHYNFHGSGWLRNYIASPTDEPSEVILAEVVRATERGNLVMTNGPFLEVQAASDFAGQARAAIPGDDLLANAGRLQLKIRVQCPNWLDINRVQILRNGVADGSLNFTRRAHRDKFADGVVKFEQTIDIDVDTDTHLIVVAAGEGLKLGQIMGPQHGEDMPIAVSNPIFVDVDGNGFQPNGDQLGDPLPIEGE